MKTTTLQNRLTSMAVLAFLFPVVALFAFRLWGSPNQAGHLTVAQETSETPARSVVPVASAQEPEEEASAESDGERTVAHTTVVTRTVYVTRSSSPREEDSPPPASSGGDAEAEGSASVVVDSDEVKDDVFTAVQDIQDSAQDVVDTAKSILE